MATLKIINNTGADVTIADAGVVIPASSSSTLTNDGSIRALCKSASLRTLVTALTLTINDGTQDRDANYLDVLWGGIGFQEDHPYRVATTEAEFDAAISDLSGTGGGTILLAGFITLTSDKTWDLNDIIVQGGDYQSGISLNGHTITLPGSCTLKGINLYGTLATVIGQDCQTVFLASEGPAGRLVRRWVFENVAFYNIIGETNVNPVIDLSGLNGGTYAKTLVVEFFRCGPSTPNSSETNTLAGLIVYGGTMGGATDLQNLYVVFGGTAAGFSSGRARYGLRRDPGSTGDFYAYADDATRIVEETNVSEPSRGTNLCPPAEIVTSGTRTISRKAFGKIIVFNNTAAAATLALPAAGQVTNDDLGCIVEFTRIGTQDVIISIPAGVTFYRGNIAYTNTTITFRLSYAVATLTVVSADKWVIATPYVSSQIVVQNELEFLAADQYLQEIGGGSIIVAGTVQFTANRTVSLNKTRVLGVASSGTPVARMQFGPAGSDNAPFALTITGKEFMFQDMQFLGTKSQVNGAGAVGTDCCTVIKISNPINDGSKSILFRTCAFRNCVGSTTVNPVIDLSPCDGQGDLTVTINFRGFSLVTTGSSDSVSLGGMILSAGTGGIASSNNIISITVQYTDAGQSPAGGANRVGSRVSTPLALHAAHLFVDNSCVAVEATNFDVDSLRGCEYISNQAGDHTQDFYDFGKLLCFTAGTDKTLTLSSDITIENAGEFFDVVKGGAGNVIVSVPGGYTAYYRGTLYTGPTTFTLDSPRQHVRMQVLSATEWLVQDNSKGWQGNQGWQGWQGGIGPQGNQGSQGSQGAQGRQGSQGYQGATGAQGNQGFQGNQGPVGLGPQGNQGRQGSQGVQGPQGNQGIQGVQGPSNTQTSVTATADDSTTSATDVQVVGMTLTPAAGTYMVFFGGSVDSSINNTTMLMSIYSGGVQVAASVRRVTRGGGQGNVTIPFTCMAVVTVSGAQAVQGEWNISGGATATMHQRGLFVLKVA
jgi:hypothetical protein